MDVPAQPIGPAGKRFAESTATISNMRGLHARAAAKFVKTAGRFKAEVVVRHRGMEVSGRSIMGLMMLAASPGTVIDIAATGEDAEEALGALLALVAGKFEEE